MSGSLDVQQIGPLSRLGVPGTSGRKPGQNYELPDFVKGEWPVSEETQLHMDAIAELRGCF